MKRSVLVFAVVIGFTGILCFYPGPSESGEGTGVAISAGGVSAGGQLFQTMTDYYLSDYFKEHGMRCRTRFDGEPQAANTLLRAQSDCTSSATVIRAEYYPGQVHIIPLVFHVISKTDGTGNISDERIYDQITVLNEDFRNSFAGATGYDTMIQFELAQITRDVNDTWFNDGDAELAYKTALGWDQDHYFNVYSNSAGGWLGYAYYPQSSAGEVRDGVVVQYTTVGGRNNGFYPPYDHGATLVHETGHYLGLLHTFEGGCVNGYTAGDLILDTNSEATPHYPCDTDPLSCGTPDPLHNYLNYTNDPCMTEFTQEQANRMVCSLVNYRPDLYTLEADVCPDCSGDAPVISGKTFLSGTTCICTGTTSITIGPGVTVEANATVTFTAPVVTVQNGFTANQGSNVTINQP